MRIGDGAKSKDLEKVSENAMKDSPVASASLKYASNILNENIKIVIGLL